MDDKLKKQETEAETQQVTAEAELNQVTGGKTDYFGKNKYGLGYSAGKPTMIAEQQKNK